MPGYAEILFNPTAAWVAPLNSDNSYGTPVQVDYLSTFNFSWESANDEIMSGGMIVEAMSIPNKATGTLGNASLNFAALSVLIGQTASDDGTTPNQTSTLYFKTGKRLPYFGFIASYEATYGNAFRKGFCKRSPRSRWIRINSGALKPGSISWHRARTCV